MQSAAPRYNEFKGDYERATERGCTTTRTNPLSGGETTLALPPGYRSARPGRRLLPDKTLREPECDQGTKNAWPKDVGVPSCVDVDTGKT